MNASPNEWSVVEIALDACPQLEIEIPTNEHLIIGAPKLSFKTTTLAVQVTRSEQAMILQAEDVPAGADLCVPIRARAPIQTESTALAIRVGSDTHKTHVSLLGSAEFVAPRCRWIVQGAIKFATPKKATFRFVNDGSVNATNVQIVIAKLKGIRVEADGQTRQLENGDLAIVLKQEVVNVGQRINLPCTLTWLDATVEDSVLRAVLTSDNSAEATFSLPIQREVSDIPALTVGAREPETQLGEPIIIDVSIDNGEVHAEDVRVTLAGDGIKDQALALGALLPLEHRAFSITSHLTTVKHREWDVPFVVTVAGNGATLAESSGVLKAKGSALLEADVTLGALDRTLARELTATITNFGTGATAKATATLKLPNGLVPVVDSLRVNGKHRLAVDGSVANVVELGVLLPGTSQSFSVRLRSTRSVAEPIDIAVTWDETTTSFTTEPVDFPDARGRDIVDEPETENDRHSAADAVTTVAPTQAKPLSQNGHAPAAKEAPQHGDTHEELPSLPSYRDTFTDAFNVLVPDDAETIELGRLVLGLYEFLPTSIPKADIELSDLRVSVGEIVERYIPSVRNGTFGASGFALVTPRVTSALRILRERLGEPAIPEGSDRTVLLGVIELADATGDLQESIRSLRAFVLNSLRDIPDEESLGNPVNIRELVG